jgi:hypothetical protein
MKNRKADPLHTSKVELQDNVKISTLAYYPISILKQRSLVIAVSILACLVCCDLNAQRLRETLFGTPEDKNEPLRWLRTEKSVAVVPEIDFVNGGMGISLARGKFIRGTQNAMAGTGYYVGYSYDTDHQINIASFGAWAGYFRRKFGGQVALKGVYYIGKEQVLGIRPEAGIGFPKMQLNYGYTLYTEKTEMQLPEHSLTLYVYFAFFSNRVNMY